METTNDNLIDKQLYISMQQGNKKAFDTLFIKYYAMLCAFARSFVSLEDAEEVVQDTMLQIWENRKTNHIDSSVHHYLFKAVKNKCYTLMTRNSLRFQRHYKIFCVNGNTGFRNESRIFYFIHLQNEEAYERKESSSA